jgi:Uroporphyrinogen decarboxylase (URO-D)
MERNPTPREMTKGLLIGKAPPRPLFLPIVFSLGAKVENVPLETFLSNPTKICSALRQMRSHLGTDGVACYFDPYLELEALGARVERGSDERLPSFHWQSEATRGEIPQGLCAPEEVTKRGRVPQAMEVMRRMSAIPQREFLLMASVTGPLTLAARMLGLAENGMVLSEEISEGAQEVAAAVVTQMATGFLQAGADTIFVQEEIVPRLNGQSCEGWANLLAPAINVVRFYEALAVLLLTGANRAQEDWEMIFQREWDCVVCAPPAAMAFQRGSEAPRANRGIALPLETFRQDGTGDEKLRRELPRLISEQRPAIITTAGDLPAGSDMKRLIRVLWEVPRDC